LHIWNTLYKDYNIEEYYAAIEIAEMCELSPDVTIQDVIELITLTIEHSLKNEKQYTHYFLANNIQYPVITTNWDCILERYGKRFGIRVNRLWGIEKYGETE